MTAASDGSLETAIALAWPPQQWREVHVVLAVSGGADSVAMLRAVMAIKARAGGAGQVVCAHFNHGLRPVAADEDEQWLAEQCRMWRVAFHAGRPVSPPPDDTGSDRGEEAARNARYRFLCQTAENIGARFVAVAHTADDQIETVLHHILRGTGLAGLAGMRHSRPLSQVVTLVRPMLEVGRQDVRRYLNSLGQSFRADETNSDPRWMRNRLRNELLPLLRSTYKADVDRSLWRLSQQAYEVQQYVADVAGAIAERAVQIDELPEAMVVRIDRRILADEPPVIVREVCKLAWTRAGAPVREMGFDQWQQLAELVRGEAEGAPLNLPGNVRAWSSGDEVQIKRPYLPPPTLASE